MKDWSKYLQEDPKKQKAAAYEMDSDNEMSPPDFNITSQNTGSSQPIQGMFASTQKMGQSRDVAKVPSSPAPVPIPYPNIGGASNAKKDATNKTKPDGLMGVLSTGVDSLSQGMNTVMAPQTSGAHGSTVTASASDYIQAVTFGKSMFKLMAKFKDLTIMGPSAIGTPGCLDGPNLEQFINIAPSVASMTGENKDMRIAVAKGVGTNFDQWRRNVMVPGLPWYPAFAAWPGPMAPPMPNVPVPLISCVSSGLPTIVMAKQLKNAIYSHLPSSMKNSSNEAFVQGIADHLAMHFLIWISSQVVMNVLGKGPVPSFAPPLVPAGPVVAGDNIAVPGHLMA